MSKITLEPAANMDGEDDTFIPNLSPALEAEIASVSCRIYVKLMKKILWSFKWQVWFGPKLHKAYILMAIIMGVLNVLQSMLDTLNCEDPSAGKVVKKIVKESVEQW